MQIQRACKHVDFAAVSVAERMRGQTARYIILLYYHVVLYCIITTAITIINITITIIITTISITIELDVAERMREQMARLQGSLAQSLDSSDATCI